MVEWLLVFTINIVSSPNELRDVSVGNVGGFQSKVACEAAATSIAEAQIRLIGQARMQRGIRGNSSASIPAINFECLHIRK
jgi:hypothetical protein